MMQKFTTLAWRNLRRNPKRSLLSGATIFVGALVLLCSLFMGDGIADGMIGNLVAIESGSVLLTYDKDGPQTKDPAAFSVMHRRVLATLTGLEGVQRVRTRLRFDAILFGPGGSSATLAVKGIDPAAETPLREYLVPVDGRMLAPDGREIYLSQQVAGQLQVRAGDQITVVLNTWGNQINAIDVNVAGVFANVAPWVDYVAYVTLPTARSLYAADISNQYLLDTARLAQAPAVVAAALKALASEPLLVRDYKRAGGFQLGIANANRYSFIIFSVVLFLVVGLGIAGLISITVRERGGEFGMLLAIGFEARQLIALLLMEIVILSGLAMAAALVAGGALYLSLASAGIELQGVARNAFGTARLLPAAHPYQLGVLVAACLGMALAGALIPARRVFKLNTDEILRKG
jgi:putative ABC transport system permease protein